MTIFVENRARAGDRRQYDLGPPAGSGERRQFADRRLPKVEEFSISESDWQKLFGQRLVSDMADEANVERGRKAQKTTRSVH